MISIFHTMMLNAYILQAHNDDHLITASHHLYK
jgi:hypothetical protein